MHRQSRRGPRDEDESDMICVGKWVTRYNKTTTQGKGKKNKRLANFGSQTQRAGLYYLLYYGGERVLGVWPPAVRTLFSYY